MFFSTNLIQAWFMSLLLVRACRLLAGAGLFESAGKNPGLES
jgi:hypothetical protein